MTEDQQKQIEREFADAKTPVAYRLAQTHAILALVDCQRKTAARVKRLGWKFSTAMAALGAGGGVTVAKWDWIQRIVFGQ